MESPHKGHRERLRAQFVEHGASSMLDHQLLELLLTFSIPRRDTNPAAHALLEAFGSLEALLAADPRDIAKVEGIGMTSAALISLAGAISRRAKVSRKTKRTVLNAPGNAAEFCIGLFADERYEKTVCISLDKNRAVLHTDVVAAGTLSENIIYPRLVAEFALRHGASSVIITHNHPSGRVEPSRADIEATNQICTALTGIGITLFDHIIVGGDKAFSMLRGSFIQTGEICDVEARAAEKET